MFLECGGLIVARYQKSDIRDQHFAGSELISDF